MNKMIKAAFLYTALIGSAVFPMHDTKAEKISASKKAEDALYLMVTPAGTAYLQNYEAEGVKKPSAWRLLSGVAYLPGLILAQHATDLITYGYASLKGVENVSWQAIQEAKYGKGPRPPMKTALYAAAGFLIMYYSLKDLMSYERECKVAEKQWRKDLAALSWEETEKILRDHGYDDRTAGSFYARVRRAWEDAKKDPLRV